jgi:Tfp pilus assembly protein PilX
MRHHPIFKRRFAAEGGFALIVAMFVLLILSVLVATAIAVASQTSTSTTRDDNSKAALEAAEAGLQVASYRLTKLAPGKEECITGTAKGPPTSGVYCESSKEPLGNGATFQYWTSKGLAVGAKCAGETIATIKSGATLRCVTSEGQVNGVTPGTRLQTPVTSAEESLFTIHGILGLKEVKITGSVTVPAIVASNEKIVGEGSANFERGFEICPPNGAFTPKAGAERNASGVKIGGVGGMLSNPSLEKTRSAGPPECLIKAPLPTIHPTAASNEDSRIGVADKLEGTYTWSEATYELNVKGTGKLTLGEAGRTTKYFFCNFTMGPKGSAQFKVPVGAKVEIFIGSPEETPKVCAAGTGRFEIAGGSQTENEAKNPAALLIEMGGKGPFTFANGSGKTLEASIYAPNAQVHMEGGVKFIGGIVGEDVFLENGTNYEWSEGTGGLGNGNPSAYGRKTWEQCTPGSGASEGC